MIISSNSLTFSICSTSSGLESIGDWKIEMEAKGVGEEAEGERRTQNSRSHFCNQVDRQAEELVASAGVPRKWRLEGGWRVEGEEEVGVGGGGGLRVME